METLEKHESHKLNATNVNATEQVWCCGEPDSVIDIFILAVMVFMCFVSVAGNSLALHVFRKAFNNLPALMFAHLATADIITGAFVMPLSIFVLATGRREYNGLAIDTICNITGCIFNTTSRASFFILAIISVGRYMAVYKTLRYKVIMTRKVSLYLLAIAWLLAALPSFIPFMFKNMGYHLYYEETICGWVIDDIPFLAAHKPVRALAYFLLVIIPIILPALVTFFCCLAVICKLYLTMAWTKQLMKGSPTPPVSSPQHKAALTLIIFAFVFVVCNGLYWVLSIKGFLDVYIIKESKFQFPSTIYFFNTTYLLIYLNSAINPFIYHFRSKGIAEKFRSLRSMNTSINSQRTVPSRYKRSNFRNRNKCIQIKDYNRPRSKITLINYHGDTQQLSQQTLTTSHSLQLDGSGSDEEVRRTSRSMSVPDKLLLSPSLMNLSPNFEMKVITRSREESFQCLSESDDI